MWNDLTMQQRADVISMAVKAGMRDLNSIRSFYDKSVGSGREFAGGGNIDNSWTMKDEAGFQEWKASLPDNLRNTKDIVYDMRTAYKSGAQPELYDDGLYHLPSRDPRTGMSLKRPVHPTHTLATFVDGLMGYHPYMKNGKEYTDTWIGNEKVSELLNPEKPPIPYRFEGGGYIPTPDGGYRVSGQPATPEELSYAKSVASWLPYVGTGIDVYDAIKEPTFENIAWAGTAVGLDLLSLGLASRARKGIKLAKEALAEGIERATKAKTKYEKLNTLYRKHPSYKRYRGIRKAWQEYDRAQGAVRESSENAFSGELRQRLFDAEQDYNKYRAATGLGGAELQGIQTIVDSTEDNDEKAFGGYLTIKKNRKVK